MKIRIVSIEGEIGNPIENVESYIKKIEEAIKDGVKLLVLPIKNYEYIPPTSYKNNNTYEKELKKANQLLKDCIEAQKDEIKVIIESETIKMGLTDIYIDITNEVCSLEGLSQLEKNIKALSEKDNSLYIFASGSGLNSVCQNVYLNAKVIAYKGLILASNLNNLYSNEVEADLVDFEPLVSSRPYLEGIDKERMFENILYMQSYALYRKMQSMNRDKIVIGISGGLDSTVSLLACVEAFKTYNIPLKNIIGVTMPGLGTTERTYNNAIKLMLELGITAREIDLKPLLKIHLKNIKQPEDLFDVTYEQCQSRERTQVLLDLANKEKAIMIGTGCMSEFALGWMSYGGDHLSMYAINIGLPKTVVKMYAEWFIKKYSNVERISNIIEDVLNGPVSPELLPIDENGVQHEKTESIIGSYEVQDFFIYHMSVNNYSIKTIFSLAIKAFPKYSKKELYSWLEIFVLRFFTRAYKKNCYGDGLQIFKYSASPSSYNIPSDISNSIWKKELEELKKEYEID